MFFFDFLHIRTPLQSLNKAFIKNLKPCNLFDEGLYLASSEYWNQYLKLEQLPEKEKQKMKNSFEKYWQRSCSRSTPFGTFAGGSVVDIEPSPTEILLNNQKNHHRIVRLDMTFLCSIIRLIEKIPEVKDQLLFYKNNNIYETPLSYRYIESQILNNTRKYKLASIEKNEFVSRVLHKVSSGASLKDLSNMLCDLCSVPYQKAYSFVHEMWDSQLLISELEPSITGGDPYKLLIDKLSTLTNIPIDLVQMSKIFEMTKNVTSTGDYIAIEEQIKSLFNIQIPKNAIQVDLSISLKKHKIEKSIVNSVFEQLSELFVFSRTGSSEALNNFKSKFTEKFGEREISLPLALDIELGIGYSNSSSNSVGGSDWVDDIGSSNNDNSQMVNLDFIQNYSLEKYYDFLKNDNAFIEIREDELLNYRQDLREFYPNSMYLIGSFLKKENKFTESNFEFIYTGFGGPSAGNLFGRFAYGNQKLEELTKEILLEEENTSPNVLFAEIVHLPEDRLGNILIRPVLRKFEIPYLGKSGANFENQILVEDLMVSVINNEIVLRSKRLNKRIIPRLSTAHNFSSLSNLPLYQFLCSLQYQNMTFPVIWDWGILKNQKHLPRVVFKNIIIQKASWKIDINDVHDNSLGLLCSTAILPDKLKSIGVPDLFLIVQADNKLLINLKIESSVILFTNIIKKYKRVELEEFLFNENNCIVTDSIGDPFVHEVIVPFKNKSNCINSIKTNNFEQNETERKFAPGSEWLYFKIYCGPKFAEYLLNEVIFDFVEKSLVKERFENFFFIRYKDTAPHLRVRFKNTDFKKLQKIEKDFTKLLKPFIDNGFISSIIIDTYVRELERYDSLLIGEAEQVFFNDSLAVLRISKLLQDVENIKYRLFIGLRGVDQFLEDFNYTLLQKKDLLKRLSQGMLNKFGGHSSLRNKINTKYKRNQKEIFHYMDSNNDFLNQINEAMSILDARSKMNAYVFESIKNKIPQKELQAKIDNLLSSYIHMFINRLFYSQQLKYELLVYVFLERYYSSISAISDTLNKNKL